ncbi:type 2 isopentenyl-diphosphate Delta-isomerase [Erysipelothrix rhusiopathiae]|nr:type 2 isopentenyl-diphosphate Delta-isomerase [Erysipelothrix rhusiopathiae]
MRSKRKDEHVALALKQNVYQSDFDTVRIVHQSLPNINLSEVDPSIQFLGQTMKYPIYINAMTGGSEKTEMLNRNLARIARVFGLPMAVGSQHAALDDKTLESSYRVVRDENPTGFIIGNVGANATVDEAKRAIAMIDANALGIHINVAQEIAMDEGDRDFAHWLENITQIVASVDVPVIVKEVGFGMSAKTVAQLYDCGVRHVDLSGRGGTNFVWIENERSQGKRYNYLSDWGITTVESLMMTKSYQEKCDIFASGGVQNPLDALKCLILGAKAVGISGYFLKVAHLESEAMLNEVSMFLEDFKRLMVLVGAKTIESLKNVDYTVHGKEV